jgi:hypothetical protein
VHVFVNFNIRRQRKNLLSRRDKDLNYLFIDMRAAVFRSWPNRGFRQSSR